MNLPILSLHHLWHHLCCCVTWFYWYTLFLLVKIYVKTWHTLFLLTLFVSIGQNVCQDLTHLRSISIGQNLHKLVNQMSLWVLADTLINKLTLTSQQKVHMASLKHDWTLLEVLLLITIVLLIGNWELSICIFPHVSWHGRWGIWSHMVPRSTLYEIWCDSVCIVTKSSLCWNLLIYIDMHISPRFLVFYVFSLINMAV